MPHPEMATIRPGDVLVTTTDHWTVKRIAQGRRTVYVLRNGAGTRLAVTADCLPKIERVERAK